VVALAATALIAIAAGAFAASTPTTTRTQTAQSAPACASPSPGNHRIAVDSAHPPVVLHVPPGKAPAAPRSGEGSPAR